MQLRCRVPAKINLTFEVLGKRPDGYHEVRTVLQAIGLFDKLDITMGSGLLVTMDQPLDGGPNLVDRAARLLQAESGTPHGATIRISKQIPIAAGLGGGSADAAATLAGLNRLWSTGLSQGRLAQLAAELGSDVPFFLTGGTALACGRGEIVAPAAPAAGWAVVLTPSGQAADGKTAGAYAALLPDHRTDGVRSQRAATGDSSAWGVNAFDLALDRLYPSVHAARMTLERQGLRAFLAGAGPSLVVLAHSEADCHTAEAAARALLPQWRVVSAPFVGHGVTIEEVA